MKLQTKNTDPSEMTTEELLGAIDSIRALSVDVVEYLSGVLSELRKRRIQHHFFSDRILSFWQEINGKQLAAEAAIGLANRPMINAVLPLPHSEQIEVSHGKEIAVATIEGKTEIMPIHRMDGPTLKRVFGPNGIRSVKAQSAIIRDVANVKHHGVITVLQDEAMLKIGNQKIKPEDLRGPLMALGYVLELSRGS